MKTVLAPALALLFLAGPVLAQTPIDRSESLSADGSVSIVNLAGSVSVRAWDRDEVRVTGTLGRAAEALRVEGDARRLEIEVVYPRNGRGRMQGADGSDLVVDLPRGAELAVATVSARIKVEGLAGSQLELRSVSGDIEVQAEAGELRLASVSGAIQASGGSARASLETVSGRVSLTTEAPELELRSVSGRVVLAAGRVERLAAATVSGDLELGIADLAAAGRIEAETMSGGVSVAVPATLSARIGASTLSGRIESDFGQVAGSRRGPGQTLEATAGAGTGSLRISSFSGRVVIRAR